MNIARAALCFQNIVKIGSPFIGATTADDSMYRKRSGTVRDTNMSDFESIEKRRPNWGKREWINFAELQTEDLEDTKAEVKQLTDALELVTRWIPVSERLPEPHTHFLALNRNGYVFESAMCYGMHKPWFTYPRGDGNASNTAPDWIDVTHWMPKPELPQSAGDQGNG